MEKSEIKIYKTPEGKTSIEVKVVKETVWLTQYQLEKLFKTNRTTIAKHILNIYKSGELEKNTTCAKIAQVHKEGNRTVKRNINYYNLDVIIAVGYRVNSKRGTEFRIWANKILKDYLLKGYALDRERLQKQANQLNHLKNTLKILDKALSFKELSNDESRGLLKIISEYSYALDLLDQYDYQTLKIENISGKEIYQLTYEEAKLKIDLVKRTFGNSELFGLEKDDSFKSSVATIYQNRKKTNC